MATRNPVLSRVEKQTGFAYEEGRSAYAQASGATAPTAAAPGQPVVIREFGAGAAVTVTDVVVKTAILFVFLLASGVVGWQLGATAPFTIMIAMFVGLGLGIANSVMQRVSPALVILYAVAEGFVLGGISKWYSDNAAQNSNIVYQAVLGTVVAFAVMLVLYATKIIRVTQTFQRMMMVGIVSYLVIGLASLVAALFGVGGGWGFYGVRGLGLLLCVVGVGLASFTLALDFESITRSVSAGLPERESWRLAFGLMVTLVWLYLEILRLLAILNRR